MNYPLTVDDFKECESRKINVQGNDVIPLDREEYNFLESEHNKNPLTKWINFKLKGFEKKHLIISGNVFVEAL